MGGLTRGRSHDWPFRGAGTILVEFLMIQSNQFTTSREISVVVKVGVNFIASAAVGSPPVN